MKEKRTGNNDIFTAEKRSAIMSAVRSKNTAFEKKVVVALREHGLRFKTNYEKVLGKPDIVMVSKKKAIFLDSDFWHGWHYSLWYSKLTSDFWRVKIDRNRRRDRKVKRMLKKRGWGVLRVWEHQFNKDFQKYINRIIIFLKEKS